MKITIYIVDDEIMAIKYFHYLLDQVSPEYIVVGESTNSVRALSEISVLKPDLVFADINMPIMDGLKLAEEILKRVDSKVFLLTSYRDFDFVKKGIQIGVTDYILKNDLDEKGLSSLLQKMSHEITVEKKKRHRLLEYNVRQFLLSESDHPSQSHIYEHKPLQRYALISVTPLPRLYMFHQTDLEKMALDNYELHALPYPDGIECSAFTEMDRRELCGVFFIRGDVTDSQSLLEDCCRLIQSYLQDNGLQGNCILSETRRHFLDLQKSYRDIRLLEDYLFAYPDIHIFRESQLSSRMRDTCVSPLLEDFSRDLEQGDHDQCLASMNDFLEKCRKNLSIWEYTEKLKDLFRVLTAFVQKKQLHEEYLEYPEYFQNIGEAEQFLGRLLSAVLNEAQAKKAQTFSSYINHALEYIRKNYDRDISIPDIAEAVGISEGHLRRLFRQEVNEKIVDYLTEYRLECAKLLMATGEVSLSEIWQKTGFASAQYFSYVFKKKEGILPKDYIKQLRSP